MPSYDPDGLFVLDDDDDEPKKDSGVPEPITVPGRRTQSRLDDLIDAVTGVAPKSRIRACRNCGGTQFMRLSPVEGGTSTRRCRQCQRIEPVATVATVAPIQLPAGQMPMGPFYGPKMRMPEKNGPLFRVRSTPEDNDDGR